MGVIRTLPLSPSQNCSFPRNGHAGAQVLGKRSSKRCSVINGSGYQQRLRVSAVSQEKGNKDGGEESEKKSKQSLFSRVTEALDFSQVRSAKDAELLYEAREATKSGGRMSREQYGALRRKIGGTYKDFFKSYVEVEGQYVEEGWVDKTCKVCKKDTRGEARQVDKFGRYVHVACLEKANSSSSGGNFFTRLFSR